MNEQFTKEVLKTIPESAVVDEVKKIIKATGLKVQRINTGCFVIKTESSRRFIKTAENRQLNFLTTKRTLTQWPENWETATM